MSEKAKIILPDLVNDPLPGLLVPSGIDLFRLSSNGRHAREIDLSAVRHLPAEIRRYRIVYFQETANILKRCRLIGNVLLKKNDLDPGLLKFLPVGVEYLPIPAGIDDHGPGSDRVIDRV